MVVEIGVQADNRILDEKGHGWMEKCQRRVMMYFPASIPETILVLR